MSGGVQIKNYIIQLTCMKEQKGFNTSFTVTSSQKAQERPTPYESIVELESKFWLETRIYHQNMQKIKLLNNILLHTPLSKRFN